MPITINTIPSDASHFADAIGNKKVSGTFGIGAPATGIDYTSVGYFVNGYRIGPVSGTYSMAGQPANTLYYVHGNNLGNLYISTNQTEANHALLAIAYKGAVNIEVVTAIENDKLGVGVLKHNYTAVTAPGVNDDIADGYEQGSEWIDTTIPKVYKCLSATKGMAVWSDVTGVGAGSPPVGFSLMFGSASGIGNGGGYLLAPGNASGAIGAVLPAVMNLKGLSFRGTYGAGVTAASLILYRNGVATGYTIALPIPGAVPPQTQAYNTFSGIAYTAGDYISLRLSVTSGGATPASNQIVDGIGTVWFTI